MRKSNIVDPYEALLRHGVIRREECLLSQGYKTRKNYRFTIFHGKPVQLHRISYQKWHGPISQGMLIDHICHNEAAARGECSGGNACSHRACVNPAHLKMVTPRENSASSPLTGKRVVSDYCKRGHPFSEENTYLTPSGSRCCRECQRKRADEYRARQRG